MGETAESLFNRGMISPKQGKKLGILKQTKVNQGEGDPDFDEKDGIRDQGGIRDRGHKAASRDHIERNQDMGSRARASGKPSKGGSVGGSKRVPGRDEIDEGGHQRPTFPREGSRVSAKEARRRVGRDAPGRSSGPQYGGPSSRRDG